MGRRRAPSWSRRWSEPSSSTSPTRSSSRPASTSSVEPPESARGGLQMAHHEVVSPERGRLQRGLRPIALFALLFLISSGGPYGTEEMIPSAGPGLAILVLIGMGLVWALPYALLVAELVSAIPEEGGPYRWYRAFLPPFWPFQFSCLDWLSYMMDAALYPTLLAAYLVGFLDPGAG